MKINSYRWKLLVALKGKNLEYTNSTFRLVCIERHRGNGGSLSFKFPKRQKKNQYHGANHCNDSNYTPLLNKNKIFRNEEGCETISLAVELHVNF